MLDNGYEVVIQGDATWAGPGHNSIIQTDDAGQEWMIYHGYRKAAADKGKGRPSGQTPVGAGRLALRGRKSTV